MTPEVREKLAREIVRTVQTMRSGPDYLRGPAGAEKIGIERAIAVAFGYEEKSSVDRRVTEILDELYPAPFGTAI